MIAFYVVFFFSLSSVVSAYMHVKHQRQSYRIIVWLYEWDYYICLLHAFILFSSLHCFYLPSVTNKYKPLHAISHAWACCRFTMFPLCLFLVSFYRCEIRIFIAVFTRVIYLLTHRKRLWLTYEACIKRYARWHKEKSALKSMAYERPNGRRSEVGR